MERFVSPEKVTGRAQLFTTPVNIKTDTFGYSGTWQVESERAVARDAAKLALRFQGKKVFLVMAPEQSGMPGSVTVLLDGHPIENTSAGADVRDGKVTVTADRLYELVNLGEGESAHQLELRFAGGVVVYAFTFS